MYSSWVTYFFHTKFSLSPSSLGNIFSVAAILLAGSALIAASLAKRIGLIPTMVFTHLPSSIALALLPFSPSLSIAIFLLLFRFSLASMDIAPKAAFLSAVILPSERTAVMGFVNMVRTGSQSLGPVIAGSMSQMGRGWVPFVMAGTMKAVYDLGLLGTFYSYTGREEQQKKVEEEDDT
jgi:MFS family permease